MTDTNELKRKLKLKAPQRGNALNPNDLLSSGSTLLNLACTGYSHGCFIKGKYHFVVGDSMSGKTFLGLTCFAEACHNHNFDDYRLIYDDVEGGALMDMVKFFGSKVVDRLEPPATDDNDEPVYSETAEQFYYHLDDAFKDGRPFVYVLDSMDALSSESEEDKFQKKKEAARKGQDTSGSYGDGKAKINSSHLRLVQRKLRETGSILIIINQTRDNLGFGFETKTRSGGRALTFYATTEIWSAVKKKITKVIKGVKRDIGILTEVKVKKNRGTGKLKTIEFPIYHSYGIDDLTACIEFLIAEKHWKMKGQKIVAPELNLVATMPVLIKHIESKHLEGKLAKLVEKVWHEVEKSTEVNRKKRY